VNGLWLFQKLVGEEESDVVFRRLPSAYSLSSTHLLWNLAELHQSLEGGLCDINVEGGIMLKDSDQR
jgi:hypothetical protein